MFANVSGRHFLAQFPINCTDLFDKAASVTVLEFHDFLQRPVKVVGQEGYLLVELFEGVAYDSPDAATSTSTSNCVAQDGQVAATRLCPFSLIRL